MNAIIGDIRSYVNKHIPQPDNEVDKNILNILIELCEILEKYREKYVYVSDGKKYGLCVDTIVSLYTLIDFFRFEKDIKIRYSMICINYDKSRSIIDKNIPIIFRKTKIIPLDWDLKADKERFLTLFNSIEQEMKKIVKIDELREYLKTLDLK